MMRFASVRCSNPSCGREWGAEVSDEAYYVDCENCQQKALVPEDARKFSGRCSKCDRPLDAAGHV